MSHWAKVNYSALMAAVFLLCISGCDSSDDGSDQSGDTGGEQTTPPNLAQPLWDMVNWDEFEWQ